MRKHIVKLIAIVAIVLALVIGFAVGCPQEARPPQEPPPDTPEEQRRREELDELDEGVGVPPGEDVIGE